MYKDVDVHIHLKQMVQMYLLLDYNIANNILYELFQLYQNTYNPKDETRSIQ